jgi:2,3-bisphosphoglycerate-independent phosphoglycerate mutase
MYHITRDLIGKLMSKNKVVLIITDGIGYSDICENNAFCQAKKPSYDYLLKSVPNSLVKTSGLSVGLPDGQMGNSEVGHMTIGSGRVLYQNLVKISKSIEDDTLKHNVVLQNTLDSSKTIHIVGLLSDGGVHSHIDHLIALSNIAQDRDKNVYFHLITDGRDVSPTSAKSYVRYLVDRLGRAKIATLSGRFYTMDRDRRWDRVQSGFDAMVKASPKTTLDIDEYVDSEYASNRTDEFLKPVAFDDFSGIEDGDGIIFANFRSDRMRQIVELMSVGGRFNIATMTEYNKEFNLPVIFEEELIKNTLAEVISRAGLNQLHTSETEKYAHVTFFLNGGVEEPFSAERRVLVPSPKVATYDISPQMSAPEVGEVVRDGMKDGEDFIVVNFANGDMVGHTGRLEASIRAVESVDREIGLIINEAKESGYSLVITSDHGNCEEMVGLNGEPFTQHTTNDVFCFILDDRISRVKSGGLSNIAPTVLSLLGLDIPKEMDSPLVEL